MGISRGLHPRAPRASRERKKAERRSVRFFERFGGGGGFGGGGFGGGGGAAAAALELGDGAPVELAGGRATGAGAVPELGRCELPLRRPSSARKSSGAGTASSRDELTSPGPRARDAVGAHTANSRGIRCPGNRCPLGPGRGVRTRGIRPRRRRARRVIARRRTRIPSSGCPSGAPRSCLATGARGAGSVESCHPRELIKHRAGRALTEHPCRAGLLRRSERCVPAELDAHAVTSFHL